MVSINGPATTVDPEHMGPRPYILADVLRKITFASHQCGIAILNELVIGNEGDVDMVDLVLEVEANPGFVKGKTWRVDRLSANSKVPVPDRDLSLNGQMLLDLSEAITGELIFRLRNEQETFVEKSCEIELLARNEWGGNEYMPELLAAFVTPNDPAVSKHVLKQASTVLAHAGRNNSFDGYESNSRSRVWEVASAIWSAVVGSKISYALPPPSFESEGQKIRTPSMVMDQGLATCLDSALLFASSLEQAGLNPVVCLLKDHALAGVWLQPEEFSALLVDDASTIRKRIALKELVLFETTLALEYPAVSFSASADKAESLICEENEAHFSLLLDIRRARMMRFRPVSLATAELATPEIGEQDKVESFESAPELPDFDVITELGTEDDTPITRLDRWQRRLLDLTLRNKLLNFKTTKAAISLYCPEPSELEDRLAQGNSLTFKEAPQRTSASPDVDIMFRRSGEQLDDVYARDALRSNQIIVNLDKDEMESRLVTIYRKARVELEEGGAITLYLALGFLVWKKLDSEDKKYRAPLILLPVTLTRRSVRSGFRITIHDDEPRINSTLFQMLRQDFGLVINGLNENDLPKDDHGIDISLIWNLVREGIKDSSGFEVVEDVVLSTFSFAKYLMWKDLVDRTDELKENPVVRHLIDTPHETYHSGIDFPDPNRLDVEFEPQDFYTPLPADSSQLTCVVAAARNKDFVLIGPPGTGKSQTISNMITHLLGEGKSVLFVSEKMAALNVVYRRLESQQLDPFCLELHSNKARKLDVLDQLRKSWHHHTGVSKEQWESCSRRLRNARDDLNQYVASMHHRYRNGFTIHHALGTVVRDKHVPRVDLRWSHVDEHNEDEFESMREVAHQIDIRAKAVGTIYASPLSLVQVGEWSPTWQRNVVSLARKFSTSASNLKSAITQLISQLEIELPDLTIRRIRNLVTLSVLLRDSVGKGVSFAFAEGGQRDLSAIEKGIDLITKFRVQETRLSVKYADRAWENLDWEEIETEWATALESWWPKSIILKFKTRKKLRAAGAKSNPDPEIDAPVLAVMRKLGAGLDDLNRELLHVDVWKGFDTDTGSAGAVVCIGKELRLRSSAVGDGIEHLSEIRFKLHQLIHGAEELIHADGSIGNAVGHLQTTLADFEQQMVEFNELTGSLLEEKFANSSGFPEKVQSTAEAICGNELGLNAWCAWRLVRNQAVDIGLTKLAEAVEDGTVPVGDAEEALVVNYCRWWLDTAVDKDRVLRRFSSLSHIDRIETFRSLDDEFAKITSQYVAAKLSKDFPTQEEVTRHTDFGILRRELEKKRRHKPLRQLMNEVPHVITQLTPCLLMSPLSVAQYLSPDHSVFDAVIFDEASQITVWDAVGSIARGRQVIVAGDPKQLPPTGFFERSEDDEDGEVDDVGDMESILDEMQGSNVPSLNLSWHYRSRHESLITFSNHQYYNGSLITFPGPTTEDKAVKLRRVDGHYDRGGSRTNREEALAVVEEVKSRLSGVPQGDAQSIGIITFNVEQQRLIEDLLDDARRKDKTLEPHFSDDAIEPVFVKNLETVQGDERDVCLFSVAYGPDIAGHVTMNFGPLNRDGGERRLNVAITRARYEFVVIATIRPDQIDLSRTSSIGVRDLKHFLQYAEDGVTAIAAAVRGTGDDFDSPFEQAIARELKRKNWTIRSQVGVSQYRIDLGVVHPDHPGRYLCGIECDGATYHRSATARDRDKIRESVLRGLGWELVRIWSTDFWLRPDDTIDTLHKSLSDLLERSRKEDAEKEKNEKEKIEKTIQESPYLRISSLQTEEPGIGDDEESSFEPPEPIKDPQLPEFRSGRDVEKTQDGFVPDGFPVFRRADLNTMFIGRIYSDAFNEDSYYGTLCEMVKYVIDIEGPLLLNDLVTRVRDVHGFGRAGSRIRHRVESALDMEKHLVRYPNGDEFVWPTDKLDSREIQPRLPESDVDIRMPRQIPMEELVALARHCVRPHFDALRGMMLYLRIKRQGRDVRRRLTEAIAIASKDTDK